MTTTAAPSGWLHRPRWTVAHHITDSVTACGRPVNGDTLPEPVNGDAVGRCVRCRDHLEQASAVPGAHGFPRPPGPVFLLGMEWPADDADPGSGAPIGLALVLEHAARRVDAACAEDR